MTASPNKPVYRLRLRSDSDSNSDRDDIHRLKQLLKILWRRFRFRCIEIMREPAP
jgi:hypothetical protein